MASEVSSGLRIVAILRQLNLSGSYDRGKLERISRKDSWLNHNVIIWNLLIEPG